MPRIHRRSLLKSAATALAQSAILRGFPSWAAGSCAAAPKTLRRVRPVDPAWPKPDNWRKLNEDVGGNLVPVQPLFAPCLADEKNAACQDVLGNFRNPFYVGDQPSGTQVSGWLDAWSPKASVYAVKARTASDVAA